MTTVPRVTVVVVCWNGAHLLPACLDGVARQELEGGVDVWVVDNASADGTVEVLARDYPQVRVLRAPRNLGFAGGNDLALDQVSSDYVALLNNDAVPDRGWLATLVEALDSAPECAVGAPKVLFAAQDGPVPVVNSVGGLVDRTGRASDRGFGAPDDGRWDVGDEVFYAPGTACLIRTEALRQVGTFDDRYFLYYEDVDLCCRLRLGGWTVRYVPSARVRHLHGASSGSVHAYHDARNRLVTMVKSAPTGRALKECLQVPLTAASLVVRGLRTSGADRAQRWATARVLLRAWGGFLRLLPHAVRQRRHSPAGARRRLEQDRMRLCDRPPGLDT